MTSQTFAGLLIGRQLVSGRTLALVAARRIDAAAPSTQAGYALALVDICDNKVRQVSGG